MRELHRSSNGIRALSMSQTISHLGPLLHRFPHRRFCTLGVGTTCIVHWCDRVGAGLVSILSTAGTAILSTDGVQTLTSSSRQFLHPLRPWGTHFDRTIKVPLGMEVV